MDNKYEYMNPNDIEKHSFEIIEQELEIELPSDIKPIVKRVIHTTADFSYAENMYFSPDVLCDKVSCCFFVGYTIMQLICT